MSVFLGLTVSGALNLTDGADLICLLRAHSLGREWSDWSSELRIPGDELKWKFTSDGSVNGWGWRFTVYPIMPAAGETLNSFTESDSLHA